MTTANEYSFRKAVYGVAALASCVYAGWLGNAMLGVGDRLVRIETQIHENREERQGQISDLRARLQRLEGDVYYAPQGRPQIER
jgi:hypothetical protein